MFIKKIRYLILYLLSNQIKIKFQFSKKLYKSFINLKEKSETIKKTNENAINIF